MDRPAATARALALLAALSSPVFMAAAIAGWVMQYWAATPLTFAIAAVGVLGGPLLGFAHVLGVRAPAPAPAPAPTPVAKPAPAPQAPPRPVLPIEPARARSLAFLAWRSSPPRPRKPRRHRRTVSAVRPESQHDHLA